MLKILSFILSAYLLVLLITPCCAFDDCPDDKVTTEATTSHSAGDSDDCGTCSPFFSCEGCAAFSQIVQPFIPATISSIVTVQYKQLITRISEVAGCGYWQPPRLS